MGSLRLVPAEGEWTVLAAWPIMATLPSDLPDAVIDPVWAALQADGATLESVVSSIPLRGDTSVRSFSVVAFDPDEAGSVLAVVRGAGAIDVLSVGGCRRFGSQGAEPWALAQFADVTGITTGTLPPVPESALRLPAGSERLVTGVARASRVVWAESSDDFADESGATALWAPRVASEVPAHTARPADDIDDDTDDDTVVSTRFHDTTDDTIVSTRTHDTVPPAPTAAPESEATAPPPPRAPSEAPSAAFSDDPSGAPIVAPSAAFSVAPSGHPAVVPPAFEPRSASAAPPAGFDVRIGQEQPQPLEHPVVIGRHPRPRLTYSGEPSLLREVASPTKAVSANHVEIAPVGATAVVTDLRSSNGTVVTQPGSRAVRLRQGDSVVVTGSAIVEIGDGNVIHISSRDRGTSGITV